MNIKVKPHTTSNAFSASWFSTFFAIPIDDTAVITLGGN